MAKEMKVRKERSFIWENRDAVLQAMVNRHKPADVEKLREEIHALLAPIVKRGLPGGRVALAMQMVTDDVLETMVQFQTE